MPFVVIDRIIIDAVQSAETESAVGAAREHDVCPIVGAGRLDAGQHVNVVISGGAGTVDRQEQLPTKSYTIYSALNQTAAEADRNILIKSWSDASVLGIG